ncbi:hypothetical protein [Rubrivirga sp. IMCC45206]|uniref:hypothetical protein n=1 Tax=Rubrivirga sp. IMCC45206 TaxID=3391614 RepID=UPI0039901CA5
MNLREVTDLLWSAFEHRNRAEGVDSVEEWIAARPHLDEHGHDLLADILHQWAEQWWNPWYELLTDGGDRPTAAGYTALRLKLDGLRERAADAQAALDALGPEPSSKSPATIVDGRLKDYLTAILELEGTPAASPADLWRKVGVLAPGEGGEPASERAVARTFRRKGMLPKGEALSVTRPRLEREAREALGVEASGDPLPETERADAARAAARRHLAESNARAGMLDILLRVADLDVYGEWIPLWLRFVQAIPESVPVGWEELSPDQRLGRALFGMEMSELFDGVEQPDVSADAAQDAAAPLDTPQTGTVADADVIDAWSHHEFNPELGEPVWSPLSDAEFWGPGGPPPTT